VFFRFITNYFSLIVEYYDWKYTSLTLIPEVSSHDMHGCLAHTKPGGRVLFMRGAHHGLESDGCESDDGHRA